MTPIELAGQIAIELIRKSGVREVTDDAAAVAIGRTASLIVAEIYENLSDSEDIEMAVLGTFKTSEGTAKVIRNTGGNAAITLASLANGNGTSTGGRQSATLDLGANWAQRWRLETNFELASTPTAGNAINLFGSWNSSTGAGEGNTSGSDAAYTGYSNNIDAATKQLELLGAHICTAQVTSTQQRSLVGTITPKGRYLNLVVDNRSGAAFHSTDTNQFITLTPLEETIEN
jgi:nucleoid DNA-binding protein